LSIRILIILLSLLAAPLSAQQPLVRYQEFHSGQDMAHTRVSCFYQDHEGFLWMGSWIGLCRYDGQQFTFFRATPGDDNPQSNNRVTKIGETAGGQLWCMTYDKRLYSFDRHRCLFDSLSADSVPARRLQHNSQYRHRWSMTDDYGVRWVMNSQEHLCWEDSITGELHPVEEALDDRYHGELPISDYHVYFVDQSHNLWVSSGTRLFRLSFGRRQTQQLPLPTLDEIRSLRLDTDGNILLGDKRGHLCRMSADLKRLEYLHPRGTWQSQPVLFASQGIYSLCRDAQQRLWIGTRGDGLYCLTQGGVTHYRHEEEDVSSISSDDIYSILEDDHHQLWIATFEGGGLCRVEEDATGKVRFLHKNNAWHDYPAQAVSVRCLAQNAQGYLLAGTNEGLLIHDPATQRWQLCRHITSDAHSLPGNTVMSVLTRPDATYVLSYGFGISRMEGDLDRGFTFRTISNRDFPNGDICVASQIDRQERIWGIGESGISCYSFQPEPTASYFNDYDFGGSYTFGEVQPLLLPTGQMALGMQGGLFLFDAEQLQKQQLQSRINVTRYSYPGSQNEEEHYVCALDSLTLTPDSRSVSIQFSSMDFQSSALKRYAYRLVDLRQTTLPEWTVTTLPEVNFINLPASEYELQMRSTNADGVWCDNQCRLAISVIPTFWETRWAYLVWLLVIITLAALIGYIVAYIHRLRRQKIELETILERHLQMPETQKVEEEVPPVSHPSSFTLNLSPLTSHLSPLTSTDEFLSALMSYIEAHISDDTLSVPSLAEQMNMSQTTLYRKLKSMVGLSPADFFRKVKMRRAMQYLATTDLPISQVAYSVGFTDPKYFSKCFKHDMGITPGEYRQRNLAK